MRVIISQTYKLRSFWFCIFTDICMVLTFPNANLCQLGIRRYQFWTSFMRNRNWQVESKLSLWYCIKHHYLIFSIKICRSKMKCLPTPLVTLSFTKTNVFVTWLRWYFSYYVPKSGLSLKLEMPFIYVSGYGPCCTLSLPQSVEHCWGSSKMAAVHIQNFRGAPLSFDSLRGRATESRG